MPDRESDHSTEAAPTAAAELGEQNTELPPPHHAAPKLAGSVDDNTTAAPTEGATELLDRSAAPTPDMAWSAETSSQPVADYIEEPRWRSILPKVILGIAASLTIGAIAVLILMPGHRALAPKAPAPAQPSASARSVLPPTSGQADSVTLAPLPEVPPPYAGCPGTAIARHDIQHKTLGAVRVFLVRTSSSGGCVAAVANTGQALLPPITVDVGASNIFAFANPATDATGNTFVLYGGGKFDGVFVLIPSTYGFEDIGWDHPERWHYTGKHAYYWAKLVGPGTDGQYKIRRSEENCKPDCANGTPITQDLHWNGSDYVP